MAGLFQVFTDKSKNADLPSDSASCSKYQSQEDAYHAHIMD